MWAALLAERGALLTARAAPAAAAPQSAAGEAGAGLADNTQTLATRGASAALPPHAPPHSDSVLGLSRRDDVGSESQLRALLLCEPCILAAPAKEASRLHADDAAAAITVTALCSVEGVVGQAARHWGQSAQPVEDYEGAVLLHQGFCPVGDTDASCQLFRRSMVDAFILPVSCSAYAVPAEEPGTPCAYASDACMADASSLYSVDRSAGGSFFIEDVPSFEIEQRQMDACSVKLRNTCDEALYALLQFLMVYINPTNVCIDDEADKAIITAVSNSVMKSYEQDADFREAVGRKLLFGLDAVVAGKESPNWQSFHLRTKLVACEKQLSEHYRDMESRGLTPMYK
jgi:hypothetical protein